MALVFVHENIFGHFIAAGKGVEVEPTCGMGCVKCLAHDGSKAESQQELS